MISNTRKRRWSLFVGAAALATVGISLAQPAEAYGWRGGWGWHGWGWRGGLGWYGPRIGIGFGFYPAPYAYAPPPVYYRPPVVYYPPPAYYPTPAAVAPPPPVVHKTTVRHHVVHKTTANPCSCPPAQSTPPASQ